MVPKLLPRMRAVVLVRDKKEAVEFYVGKLGFEVAWDSPTMAHVVLSKESGTGIWLLQPAAEETRRLIGKQTGDEPCLVLYTNDCLGMYERLRQQGVRFRGEPVDDPDDVHVHFDDPYGNQIVLVELKGS